MSINRYNAKRDKNEPEIIQALTAFGCSVIRIDTPVDLIVGFQGFTALVEVKSEKGVLTALQKKHFENEHHAWFIVRDIEGAKTIAKTIKAYSEKL